IVVRAPLPVDVELSAERVGRAAESVVGRELVHVERDGARRKGGGGEKRDGAEKRARPEPQASFPFGISQVRTSYPLCPRRSFAGPGPTRGYIIARVSLRLLLIEPLTAAAPERPSAVSFLRGLAAKSAFLLAATVGLNLLVGPLGVHGSRLFDPIALKTRGTKLYLYDQTRPQPVIVVLRSSRRLRLDPRST